MPKIRKLLVYPNLIEWVLPCLVTLIFGLSDPGSATSFSGFVPIGD